MGKDFNSVFFFQIYFAILKIISTFAMLLIVAIMTIATLKKSIEWTHPNDGTEITLEDYRNEMKETEFSGD